jgi:hypothetical protein
MADVVMNLIDPLEARYRWDKTDDQIALAKRDMAEMFRAHPVDLLQATVRSIVLHRKFSTMPTVGDINDVLQRIVAERRAAEAKKPTHNASGYSTAEAFAEGLRRDREAAKEWARDWLRQDTIGRQSLAEGWCRALHNLIWQVRMQLPNCNFEDIRAESLATQSAKGEALIAHMRNHTRAPNPKFEAALVLKEKWVG